MRRGLRMLQPASRIRCRGIATSTLSKPLGLNGGTKRISRIGVGDHLTPGETQAAFQKNFVGYFEAGGNVVQILDGVEGTMADMVEMQLMNENIRREDLVMMSSFPRRVDPMRACSPPSLAASVYYNPPAYPSARSEAEAPPPLSVPGTRFADLIERLDAFVMKTQAIMRMDMDLVMIDVDLLVQEAQEASSYTPEDVILQVKALMESLEVRVGEGMIAGYGVSSSKFGMAGGTSLETMLELSHQVSAAPSFKAICGTVNALEGGMLLPLPCAAGTKSTLQLARDNHMCVFATSALNSFDTTGGDIRLWSYEAEEDDLTLKKELSEAFSHVLQFEQMYPELLLKAPSASVDLTPQQNVAWGQILLNHDEMSHNAVLWQRVLHHRIMPCLHVALQKLLMDDYWNQWALEYRKVVMRLFASLTACSEHAAAFQSRQIARVLDEAPELAAYPDLQTKSLAVAMHSGVDCVLTDQLQLAPVLQPAAFDSSVLIAKCSAIYPPAPRLHLS